MKIIYPSAITDIAEQNSSFDACMIRVMYTGKNRNRTFISKAAVERALPTIYNCPIVCNYNVQEDTIGGHDVDIVATDNGVKMINLTDAIGVIPAGASYHWEEIKDGEETHEYLCIGGLLWKRTPAYEKIKRDGVSGQSMEIDVINGKSVDGYYEIDDFSFTAFCILGDNVTPCFESASLETFSLALYKQNIAMMMEDFKREFSVVIPASADDKYTDSLKGGEGKVNIDELMAKYGLSAEDIDFNVEEFQIGELEEKFAEIANAKKFDGDAEPVPGEDAAGELTPGEQDGNEDDSDRSEGDDEEYNDDDDALPKDKKEYTLTAEQFARELVGALRKEMIYDECWECEVPRYWYVDYDTEAREVYAEDRKDCNLYGMHFDMDGDHVVIDFSSAKRKKVTFVDFDEGDEGRVALFSTANEIVNEQVNRIKTELADLRKFKIDVLEKELNEAKARLFEKFADLWTNTTFDELRKNNDGMSIGQIEEKCYAIRGRNMDAKFSANEGRTPIRTPVENTDKVPDDEPYGGIFLKYGIRK